MRREIMEAAGLEAFAEVGLVLFLIAFALIVLRALFAQKEEIHHAQNLPLEDGTLNGQESHP
ncbi:hypothetical protein DV096_12435 [Bradymonadaceae bacterium TMQ3]|uniref:CcoQ/FixQ family Cbb3-type cytochrome c oxidase assembly chaperone n=1 Tax=Lujinxingia sediminis TaxID=2480984 RepID=A0ABY0CQI7_9DELT|nr:hypothetical protein [Lujinxingia sediminis]RDV37910.1 hypothetical protein DV096_12435 [Bradymonadaceae bacterium TMQ3]RVU42761.1 hypothetical protein EA187_14715 [Lujinxingia sediminis]TXC75311.1 hypothetical protein FRC91_11345 [Bradymonadales bacterium TMQ1]